MSLDDRKLRILQAIIDDYILTAMPVGSRAISRKQGMGLSSATIRNEMSDLEELGYLDQPHTSAGRIPSWRAYRLYVDQLLRVAGVPSQENLHLQRLFSQRMRQMEEIVSSTAEILSDMTDYAAVVLMPRSPEQRLRRVQFVRVSQERALMVVVFESGQTKEALVHLPADWSDEHLYMMSSYITKHLDGHSAADLDVAFSQLGRDMAEQRAIFADVSAAIRRGMQPARHQVVLGGASKLLNYPEYADVEKAKHVLGALETRDQLAQVLSDRAGLEFSVSIGPEIQVEGMKDCSLVTVSYSLGGERTGTMGVIGPTRMHYARVLSVLESMRQVLREISQEEG